MPEIRLVDLPVICRYSLAVRQEAAPAEEVLAVLDASREAVLAAMGEPTRATEPSNRPKRSGGRARSTDAPAGSSAPTKRASQAVPPSSVSARLTPRPPGSRNPVRALAALAREGGGSPRRRSR